jgi:FixJ family two-component response regulator
LERFHPIDYGSAEAFLADDRRPRFDCLVLDIRLGGMSGLELFACLAADETRPPVIFVTAVDEPRTRAQAEALGCAGFFSKSTPGAGIVDAIRRAAALAHRPS